MNSARYRAATGWIILLALATPAFGAADALTIHYHRFDGDYRNMTLWTWDQKLERAPAQNELEPVGQDTFGLVFRLDPADYGGADDGVGLLPRRDRDWGKKDGGDRIWLPRMGKEIYMVQDDNRLYTEQPDVSPKVRSVTLDAPRHLTIRFTHALPAAEMTANLFEITTVDGEPVPIKAIYPFQHEGDRCAVYSIETEEPFDYPGTRYRLAVAGFGEHVVRIGHIQKDPLRFYDAETKLGATYTSAATAFAVFAPGATGVHVVIADEIEGTRGIVEQELTANAHGVWSGKVIGDLKGKFYAYKLDGPDHDPAQEVTDIYATCTQGLHARSLIVDLDETDPPGFRQAGHRPLASPTDAIIYEIHVRDLTISPDSGVRHKGKYLGLTETGTHLPDEEGVSTALDHISEMGVTHVQIMPVQDFYNQETGNDTYNWGYMPIHFNSPDGWYASSPRGAAKITEFKQVVKAFHDRGIGVIMDVVYNHTAGEAPFEQLAPGYYFRMTPEGRFSNGSGCGNEFASECPMARRFILDSVKFWVEEYQVDGFRFDLMGLIDLETMRQIKKELASIHPGVLVYGEPWAAGATPLNPVTNQSQTPGTGVGAFNDHFRDAIKGDRDGGSPGFIQNGSRRDRIINGLKGAIDDWARDPVDTINYFEAHDNLTAWDKLLQSAPGTTALVRRRMMRFGALLLFTSQGTIFVHSGQEMCRTKGGSDNSYNLPDNVNQIEWRREVTFADVVAYHEGLIALRRAHPALRLATAAEVQKRVSFPPSPNDRSIVYRIDAAGVTDEPAGELLVLLNGADQPTSFELPDGDWSIHADADRASVEKLGNVSGTVDVLPHSGLLLAR